MPNCKNYFYPINLKSITRYSTGFIFGAFIADRFFCIVVLWAWISFFHKEAIMFTFSMLSWTLLQCVCVLKSYSGHSIADDSMYILSDWNEILNTDMAMGANCIYIMIKHSYIRIFDYLQCSIKTINKVSFWNKKEGEPKFVVENLWSTIIYSSTQNLQFKKRLHPY